MTKEEKKSSTVEAEVNEESEVVVPTGPMAELMNTAAKKPGMDEMVEGPVIAIGRARVFVDLHPFGTGIIYGREYLSARETLKNVNIGDIVAAKIVGTETAEGYMELSL
ncbi:hypothetical protein HYT05_02090, partial [Candidatus Kaiserbacteria bacterium]|nr:hypothetical protein [Candidatus Kaiserbacteria bacterium]